MSDLSQIPLTSLTDRGITTHIASRFHQGLPFSTISTKTLVALNTFTDELDINQDQVFRDLATRIHNRMSKRLEDQCCIFLGENGSGKSEYVASLSKSLLTLASSPLSTRCRSLQSVIDAFSTAKTASSLASSRVGIIREFQYDSNGDFAGLAIYDYRLERQRVTKVATNERNYHVFYYMVNGLSSAEKRHLRLETNEFKYLGHSSQLHLNGVDDVLKFKQLKLALYSLGFSRAEVANIFQVLAAILHLGQINIRDIVTDASQKVAVAVEVVNVDVMNTIAQFLGVPSEVLYSSIVSKTVVVNNDRVTVMMDQRGAKEQTDTLARALYAMLFGYLMDRVNSSLALDSDSPQLATTISLVDFPGFQHTPHQTYAKQLPHLDRLLHNCANEMLYNYLVHVYFRAPEDVLESEEVSIPATEYFDNAETVKILAKPHSGILSVINDYALNDRDDYRLSASLKRRYPESLAVRCDLGKFTINHFAGEAQYSTQDLLDSVRETLSTDIINIFAQSTQNDFLQSVFRAGAVIDTTIDDMVVQAHVANEPRRQVSQRKQSGLDISGADEANLTEIKNVFGSVRRSGSVRYNTKSDRHGINPAKGRQSQSEKKSNLPGILNYIQSLDESIDAMESEHAYFVLCLKPNDSRLMSSLDARCVRQQVSALGIPELAHRTRNTDLSIFMPFNEFLRYFNRAFEFEESERETADRILNENGWSQRDAVTGITGVLLSENSWIKVVDPSLKFVEDAAEKFANENNELAEAYAGQDLEVKSLVGGFGNIFSSIHAEKSSHEIIDGMPELVHDAEDCTEPPKESVERKAWLAIVWLYTWWYPTAFIKGTYASVKIAWREKLAINLIIWGICASSMIILIGLPYFICPLQNVMSEGQLEGYSYTNNADKVYTSIRGTIYDISKFASSHYPSIVPAQNVLRYSGKDISNLFPVPVSAVCSLVAHEKVVIGDPTNYTDPNAQYHDFRGLRDDYRPDWYLQHMEYFNNHLLKSFLGYTPDSLHKKANQNSKTIFSLHGYVYDISDYINGNIYDLSYSNSSTSNVQFLDPQITNMIQQNNGKDVSSLFKKLSFNESYNFEVERCLRNLFMIGKLDTQDSARCLFARYFLLAVTVFVVVVIVIKFLAALQFGSYEYPDDLDKFVICQVPVYTEDEESLRRAIDSLATTKYDDKRKLLVVICDGMIVGAGNEKPTPRIVLDILGHPEDVHPPALSFESLGEGDEQHNYGKVYTGLYETGGHIVPYLVVVKVGKPTEVFRPGNRGKRDSQILIMRFLNRVHYNLPMSPLELEMYHQIQNVIGISPSYYSFLMQVDADTVVAPESLSQLMGAMTRNMKVQAICGETELSNARQSLVTMIQVYEYYISHNLAKAFESLFGTVTCLPGCFTLYRLYEEDSGKPLLISHPILDYYSECSVKTLHSKNLLQLGEDRYLTTLLLRFNPRYSTKFLRHAHAYTIAPDSWSILLSQRRRWINSTVHNMAELVPMNQLCGFCCFSMRFMVLIDLLSTFLQPVTIVYIAYLIYLCVSRGGTIPWSSIALLAAVYGLQMIVFLLRLKWEMIGWMFIYLLAMPIHSLLLPLYSFWYMDDFSWGNTRMVVGEKGKAMLINDEGHFDPSEIPLKKWSEYEDENWIHDPSIGFDSSKNYDDSYSVAPTARFLDEENPFVESSIESMFKADIARKGISSKTHSPSDIEITDALRAILAESDLGQVTKRSIRTDLESQFNCNLDDRKEYISVAIEALLSGEML